MIVKALLDMFNDIRVVKYDRDGNPVAEKDVPISFAPREKFHDDRIEDNWVDANNVQHGNRYYLTIPRMALTPTAVIYDADRATGVNQWRYWKTEVPIDNGMYKVLSDYQPTPYNFTFTLSILSDAQDYFAQIIENILPYFNPALTLRVKEFSFLNIERDMLVTMDGVNLDFSDDLTDMESRRCNGSINLTVRGWMYRPFVYSDIIKFIDSKYYIGDKSTDQLPLVESYSTSGVMTSGGTIIDTSAVPLSGTYQVSGDYYSANKEFKWFSEKDSHEN
jgi:hypothetical protein